MSGPMGHETGFKKFIGVKSSHVVAVSQTSYYNCFWKFSKKLLIKLQPNRNITNLKYVINQETKKVSNYYTVKT
jgi:hypothetical protein